MDSNGCTFALFVYNANIYMYFPCIGQETMAVDKTSTDWWDQAKTIKRT